MQKFLLSVVFIGLSVVGFGQSDIVFSQYIETNSGTTPKGFEIMNVSGSDIDLSTSNIQIYKGTNGASCSADVTINSGTLKAGEVWVVGTSDLLSYSTSNGSDLSGTTSYTATHNGDDAYSLYLGAVIQDMIGVCGSDPGSSWSGSGVSTANQNIELKDAICDGDTDGWTDPSTRFEYVADGSTMTGFGDAPHTCGSSTPEVEFDNVTITATEGSATASVDLSISAEPSAVVTVTITYSSGTAGILDDGSSFSEIVTFPASGTANQPLTIDLSTAYDVSDCGTEDVLLQIASVSGGGAVKGTDGELTLTLEDDDCSETCETFANIPASSSSYSTRTWTGDNGDSWSSEDSRTDQTLSGSKAIAIRTGDLEVSPSGGIGTLTFDYARVFSGNSTLTVKVNGSTEGSYTVSSTSSTTATISNINVEGSFTLTFSNSGNRTLIDNVCWTAYEAACSTPTAASSPVASSIEETTATLGWSGGAGSKTLVVVRTDGSSATAPIDGTDYTANTAYGSGNTTAANNYVVYAGSGASVNVTALSAGTTYFFDVYEFNETGTDEPCYSSAVTTSFTTVAACSAPAALSSGGTLTVTGETTADISFPSGAGDGSLVVLRPSANGAVAPSAGTIYSGNSNYPSASNLGSNNRVVYRNTGHSVSVSNLSAATEYVVDVYEYEASESTSSYPCYSAAYTIGTFTTDCDAPETQASATSTTDLTPTSATINFTRGNGNGVLVVARQGEAVDTDPTLQTDYTANAAFGSGAEIGSGNYVVYKGTASTFSLTGLSENTEYHLAFYEYNASGGDYCFFLSEYTFDFTTAQECDAPSTATSFTNVTSITGSSATINTNRSSADGDEYIIVFRTTGTPSSPTGGTTYTANTDYSAASAMEGVGKVVYKGTATAPSITGLTPGETYNIDIHEVNDNGNYLNPCYTTNASAGSFTTQDVDLEFNAASSSVDEDGDTATVVLSVTNNLLTSDASVRITYATNDGDNPSVTNGTTQDITISAGSNDDISVKIPIDDNFVCDNASETITLSLTYLAADDRVAIGSQSTHQITVVENEEAPSNQASSIQAANIRTTQASLSWTKGSDAYGSLIVVKATSTDIPGAPITGTTYTASSSFGAGDETASGSEVVYSGTGTSVSISNLSANSTYIAAVYAYNGENCYLSTSPDTVLFSTTQTSIEFYQTTGTATESGTIEVCLVIENNDNGASTEVTLVDDNNAFTGEGAVTFVANSNDTVCVTLTHSTNNSTCDSYSDVSLSLSSPTNGATIGGNSTQSLSISDDEFYLDAATIFSEDFSGDQSNFTLNNPATTVDDPDDGNPLNGAEDGEYIWDFSSNALTAHGITGLSGTFWLMEDLEESNAVGNEDGVARTAEHTMTFDNVSLGASANEFVDVQVSFQTATNGTFASGELQYSLSYNGTTASTLYTDVSSYNGSTSIAIDDSETDIILRLVGNFNGDDKYAGWDNILITGKQCVTCNTPVSADFTTGVNHSYQSASSATLSFTKDADVDAILVVAKAGSEITVAPANKTIYSGNNTLGSGDNLGGSSYAVYNGSGSSFTLSGLTIGQTYYLKFFDYNEHPTNNDPCYATSGVSTYAFTHNDGAIVYTYNGPSGSASYKQASNWSPNRVSPASSDLLKIVDSDVTLTGFTSESVSHFGVYGNANATLQGSTSGQTLTVNSDSRDSAEFVVDANAIFESATTNPVSFSFGADVEAEIDGAFKPNGGNLSVADSITVRSNAFLTFTSGDLTNNGHIVLLDDASLIQGTGSTIAGSGTYSITRNRPDGQASGLYNFWSTPISNTVLMSELNATSKYQLNAPGTLTAHWSVVNGSTALTVGRGYALRGIATHTFNGTVNNGDINREVERDQGTGLEFNVFGNPYPSAINAYDFCFENSSIMDGYINLFNHNPNIEYTSANQQITINNMGATVAGITDEDQTLSNTYIASCQGFYAPLLDGTDGQHVSFTNSMRGGDNSQFKSNRKSFEIDGKFWIHLVNGQKEYTTLIGVSPHASAKYDWGWDAKANNPLGFFMGTSLPGGLDLNIQSIGSIEKTTRINLLVGIPGMGDYQIKLRPSSKMDFGNLEPFLLDKTQYTIHPLLEGPYNFYETEKQFYRDRFEIVFARTQITPNSISESTDNQEINVLRQAGELKLKSIPVETTEILFFDLQGKLLHRVKPEGKSEMTLTDIQTDILIILAKSEDNLLESLITR